MILSANFHEKNNIVLGSADEDATKNLFFKFITSLIPVRFHDISTTAVGLF